jgi:hypothetical protein
MLAGGLAASFFADTAIARASEHCTSDLACRASVRRMFSTSLDAARTISESCAGRPEPLPTLIDALCCDAGARETLANGSPEQVRAFLGEKIQKDFRAGRVRRVDGWVLSETEIRLFSIAAAA